MGRHTSPPRPAALLPASTTTTVTLIIPLVVLVSVALAADICDTCKCPQMGQEITILCHCCPDMRDMDFAERVMRPSENMSKVTRLVVSDCNSVAFRQDALTSLRSLTTLEVVNVTRLDFDAGAFEKLGALRVENVKALGLAANAFFATELAELHVQGARLQTLPSRALANVRGLHTVVLRDVNVQQLLTSAIILNMTHDSSLTIKGCLVDSAEPGSLVVQSAGSLLVEDSTFRNLDAGAVSVNAHVSALVNNSDLTDSESPQALCVVSPEVTVTGSRFKKIPECLLRPPADNSSSAREAAPAKKRKLIFQKNQLDADLISLVQLTGGHDDDVTYRYNRLSCDCVVEFGKKLAAIGSEDPGVLDNNYCSTEKCPNQLPLSILVKYLEEANAAQCSEEELCKRAPTTTTTTVAPQANAQGGAPLVTTNVAWWFISSVALASWTLL